MANDQKLDSSKQFTHLILKLGAKDNYKFP